MVLQPVGGIPLIVRSISKNWDYYVSHAEEVARTVGFQELRDQILQHASPLGEDVVIDIGSGTGLLTLPLAHMTKQVWALDISQSMCDYLDAKAKSAGLTNIESVAGSAVSLPIVDQSIDLAVSNYCFHHLANDDKQRALKEIHRVLRPGGRLVFADMMFRISMTDRRDRTLVVSKLRSFAKLGPAGMARIAKNGIRIVSGRWEHPVRADWWNAALNQSGFTDVDIELMSHEGGIAVARRP